MKISNLRIYCKKHGKQSNALLINNINICMMCVGEMMNEKDEL